MAELVEMEGETLLSEAHTKDSSELEKMIQGRMGDQEEVIEEVDDVEPDDQEETPEVYEQEEAFEEDEDPKEAAQTQQKQQEPDKQNVDQYKQGQQDILDMIRNGALGNVGQTPTPQSTPKEKEESNDQFIERFANDPKTVLAEIFNKNIDPHKQDLKAMEESRALDSQRLYNKDFSRLEPTIEKIFKAEPNIGKDLAPTARLELGYLIARGLEADQEKKKSVSKEQASKEKRLKQKTVASSMPKGSKRVSLGKAEKKVSQMTSSELASKIRSLSRA